MTTHEIESRITEVDALRWLVEIRREVGRCSTMN